MVHVDSFHHYCAYNADGDVVIDEEMATVRRVARKAPFLTYVLPVVEFAERGSFYGIKQVFNNFVNRP
jgi:dipeptide/tripeptide permease